MDLKIDWIWAGRNKENIKKSDQKDKPIEPLDVSEKEQMQLAKILRKIDAEIPLKKAELLVMEKFDLGYFELE